MSLLDKMEKRNWAANESWKIEEEFKATYLDWASLSDGHQSYNANTINTDKVGPLAEPNAIKYIPGKVFHPLNINSSLTKKQQAACLSVLLQYQAGCDLSHLTTIQQRNVALYKQLQSKIQAENEKFSEHAKQSWRRYAKKAVSVRQGFFSYGMALWKKSLLRALNYSQFYKQLDVMPWSQEPPTKVMHVKNVLRMGAVAEFCPPSLLFKYIPKNSTLPAEDEATTYNSKLSVSEDNNVENLLDANEVDIVISSSALIRLMDNVDDNIEWDIPVIVKERKPSGDDKLKTKNVVYLDKCLPKRHPNGRNFNEKCHKRVIKTNFCAYPLISYSDAECEIANRSYTECAGKVRAGNKIHHNVTYDLWSVQAEEETNHLVKRRADGREIKFLLRQKMDGCEVVDNATRLLVVEPKLECQIEYGAGIPTKSELIRQWTRLFFRPFSHLYRVRMQYSNSEVISIESVNLQKVNNEAMLHHDLKPCARLGGLYSIFHKLTTLASGVYLLHHTPNEGQFVKIMQGQPQLDPSNPNCDNHGLFDLHAQYGAENCRVVKGMQRWCPIDVHYVLPVHLAYRRMPGMFQPVVYNHTIIKGKGNEAKRRRKNAKKKEKRKAANKTNSMKTDN